jgi:hypothetical protein
MSMNDSDIQMIIEQVTFLLKIELNNWNKKNKELVKETSEGILNLPIVKKIIGEYETKITNDSVSDEKINNVKNMVIDLKTELQEIKAMLSSRPIISNVEPNIQLKITELENSNTNDLLDLEIINRLEKLDLKEEVKELSEAKQEVSEEEQEEEEEVSEAEQEEEEQEEEEQEEEEEVSEAEQEEVSEEEQEEEEEEQEQEEEDIGEAEEEEVAKVDKQEAVISKVVEDAEEEDEEVFEIEIDDDTYFTNNEENGILYEIDENGEPGKKVGIIKDGEPIFS